MVNFVLVRPTETANAPSNKYSMVGGLVFDSAKKTITPTFLYYTRWVGLSY